MSDQGPTTRLDPRVSSFVTIVGRKGSGKSQLARSMWREYPFDRLVVDPTGDVDPGDPRAQLVEPPLPATWPMTMGDQRKTLRFIADPKSPTFVDDMDRAVGMTYWHPHKRAMLWLDEVHMITTAHMTPPNLRLALIQGRHRNLSVLACGPRPMDVDPLVLQQSDFVAVFDLPNPKDRERVANTTGIKPATLDALVDELDPFHYLWIDAKERFPDSTTIMPPVRLVTQGPPAPEPDPMARS